MLAWVNSVTRLAMGSIHFHSQHEILAECSGNLTILISEYDRHFDLCLFLAHLVNKTSITTNFVYLAAVFISF